MSRDVIALWCHTGSYAGVEWPSQLFFNGFHFKPPGEGFIYGLTGAIYDSAQIVQQKVQTFPA